MIWQRLIELSERIERVFDSHLSRYTLSEEIKIEGWHDIFWKSEHIRKCHLKTIDSREKQGVWLMHVNIFPKEYLNTPILGFDVVAGKNKITGSFFDYSPIDNHPFMDYYYGKVKGLSWNKPRELPDWARSIFSENMIAAGNIKSEEEIQQLSAICLDLIEYYVTNIGKFDKIGYYKDKQNYYCSRQKINPHLHRSILSMGVNEEDKDRYINNILFEEI